MPKVYVSAVLDTSLEVAWNLLRDFSDLGNYHPFFENSFIEDCKKSDQVGCIRNFRRRAGGVIREQLLALSDDEHRCRYAMIENKAGWINYVAELHLLPITQDSRCFGEWWATWQMPSPSDDVVEAEKRVAETFRLFFEGVNKRRS